MWRWIQDHGDGLEAIGALVTALVAIAALIGVKFQIDASERIQREQAAREIYREFLNISIQNPRLRNMDYCAASSDLDRAAYQDYVEYMLYTTEQVIEADPEWAPAMVELLAGHADYLCERGDWALYPASTVALVREVRANYCDARTACADRTE